MPGFSSFSFLRFGKLPSVEFNLTQTCVEINHRRHPNVYPKILDTVICLAHSDCYRKRLLDTDTAPPKEPIKNYKPIEPLTQSEREAEAPHGHFHVEPHAPVEQPSTAQGNEPITPVSERPAYIYDPEAKERPDGWDPELVFDTGHGKVIDLNYRPLTEEEQAEYEHLKATLVPPDAYGLTEAGLIITAIGNIQRKNAPAFMKSLEADMLAGKSREYRMNRLREFHDIFAD